MIHIIVYTLPACVQCDTTKRYLTRAEIPFTIIDLSADPAALEYVQTLGYTSAPVVIAGNQHWSGFRADKLAHLVMTAHLN